MFTTKRSIDKKLIEINAKEFNSLRPKGWVNGLIIDAYASASV